MPDAGVVFYIFFQVNVVSYKTRPTAKDFIQVEIVVEKNSQKIILIGKVMLNCEFLDILFCLILFYVMNKVLIHFDMCRYEL